MFEVNVKNVTEEKKGRRRNTAQVWGSDLVVCSDIVHFTGGSN